MCRRPRTSSISWTGFVINRSLLVFAVASVCVFAELSPEQRVSEFRQLAGLYAKNYGPYEWKRDTQNFDLMHISPWLERARTAKDDLDFADLMIEYVSKLNDGHDLLMLRSTYWAYLGFDVDQYDGKPLIDFIDRAQLPRTRFPFDVGDELVSIDGFNTEELIERFRKYSICGNDLATRRQALLWLTYRDQRFIPRAHEIPAAARVVVRRASDGAESTVNLAWFKSGRPMASFGTLPNPFSLSAQTVVNPASLARDRIREMQTLRQPRSRYRAVQGVGVRAPLFAPPDGFVQRLGRSGADAFYSGTFKSGGLTIGYIRIPDFDPAIPSVAANQFVSEMVYFQANTDGLVIDLMRNPGGSVEYANYLISAVMPDYHRVIGFEIRATSYWVTAFSQALAQSDELGDPPWVVDWWRAMLRDIRTANSENRGRTGPLPLDSGPDFEPSLIRPPLQSQGRNIAYGKPLLVLVDEFTASGGDAFAATIQDNKRGKLFGMRTMGLGGNVFGWGMDGYAEVDLTITASLMARKDNIDTGGEFPVTYYVENVGVRPEIINDYMTANNLRNRGRDYVQAFTQAIVDHIRASQPKENEQ